MTNTFNKPHVSPGDTMTITEGLYTYTATIYQDCDAKPEEFLDADCPEYGEENRKAIDTWNNNRWYYGGIVIDATYNGVDLGMNVYVSLWGVEVNHFDSNAFLDETVNDLMPEARKYAAAMRGQLRDKLTQEEGE